MIRAENRLDCEMLAQRLGIFERSEKVAAEFSRKQFDDHLRIDGGYECAENVGIRIEADPLWGY